jgi:predicted Fe-S protein YdhL (DUF1289 family)
MMSLCDHNHEKTHRCAMSSSDQSPNSLEYARQVIVILLAGAAIVLALIVLTYLIMMLLDRCTCCGCNSSREEIVPVDILWKRLRRDERRQLLEYIFADSKTMSEEDLQEQSSAESTEQNENEASSTAGCCICLNDYQVGDEVLTGRACTHCFHRTCALEWLVNRFECPYCRTEIMNSREVRQVAVEVLGEERTIALGLWVSRTERERQETPTDAVNEVEMGQAVRTTQTNATWDQESL